MQLEQAVAPTPELAAIYARKRALKSAMGGCDKCSMPATAFRACRTCWWQHQRCELCGGQAAVDMAQHSQRQACANGVTPVCVPYEYRMESLARWFGLALLSVDPRATARVMMKEDR